MTSYLKLKDTFICGGAQSYCNNKLFYRHNEDFTICTNSVCGRLIAYNKMWFRELSNIELLSIVDFIKSADSSASQTKEQ